MANCQHTYKTSSQKPTDFIALQTNERDETKKIEFFTTANPIHFFVSRYNYSVSLTKTNLCKVG